MSRRDRQDEDDEELTAERAVRRPDGEEPGQVEFAEGEEPRAVIVGVFQEPRTPNRSRRMKERARLAEELDELEALLDTLGAVTCARLVQGRKSPDSKYFIGEGKARTLREIIGSNHADFAVFDDDLSPAQNRNLERLLGKPVMDRTAVILEIFSQHARTATSKLQVELAHLRYLLPRLKRAWTHLSRQKGAVTMRGVGEKQIELDRRMINTRIATLETKLKKLAVQGETRREGRRNMFKVALVGYTNSGKSTLLNVLTDSDVLVADKLFATLDATTRKMTDVVGLPIMVSDTVGFIRKLPHALVASFRSTLEETYHADLLLEVVDLSSPNFEAQREATDSVLEELELHEKPRILVFNKTDQLPKPSKLPAIVRSIHAGSVCVSARTGEGVDELRGRIQAFFDGALEERVLHLESDEGGILSEIYEHAHVENVEYRDDGVIEVRFRASPREHDSIDRMLRGSR